MRPQEKAISLVEIFKFNCKECDCKWNAKQSALRTADEIMGVLIEAGWDIKYWIQVKQEIEKL